MKGIRLSEKHGVNPTLPKCFWCGEDTGEVALLGRLPDDAEAPRSCFLSYDRCPACKEMWAKGVVFIEVETGTFEESRNEIAPGALPTGRHFAITRDAFERIFDDSESCVEALRKGKCLVLKEDYEAFITKFGVET